MGDSKLIEIIDTEDTTITTLYDADGHPVVAHLGFQFDRNTDGTIKKDSNDQEQIKTYDIGAQTGVKKIGPIMMKWDQQAFSVGGNYYGAWKATGGGTGSAANWLYYTAEGKM